MLSEHRAPRQRDAPRAGAVLAPARPPTRQRGLRASAIPARAGATFAPACAKARWWSCVLARPKRARFRAGARTALARAKFATARGSAVATA